MLPSLPTIHDAFAGPLSWCVFDTAADKWITLPQKTAPASTADEATPAPSSSDLTLVTWNIDAFGYEHAARLNGILSAVRRAGPRPQQGPGKEGEGEESGTDIVFLQEVSGTAKRTLVADPWVRAHYYIGGVDWFLTDVNHQFYNITLLSRCRFPDPAHSLGAVWWVEYPSRYGRYAMCCDVAVASPSSSSSSTVRLVNVHLDSLPTRPSKRPRQLQIIAAMLRVEGVAAGLVAGDFNPVLPGEDDGLVAANGLVDCWTRLHHEDDKGFTWGVDGKERFPPGRLDKVAVLRLVPKAIEVLHPETVQIEIVRHESDEEEEEKDEDEDEDDYRVPWSDHSGLVATIGLV